MLTIRCNQPQADCLAAQPQLFVSWQYLVKAHPQNRNCVWCFLVQIRWYDLKYVITTAGTSMSCIDTFFCPLTVSPLHILSPVTTPAVGATVHFVLYQCILRLSTQPWYSSQ